MGCKISKDKLDILIKDSIDKSDLKLLYKLIKDHNIQDQSLLIYAIKSGQIDVTAIFLSNNFQLNTLDEKRKFPIDYAIELGYVDVCKFLLQNGASLIVDNHKKYFLEAAYHNNLDMVKLFVENGKFDIEMFDEDWETPVFKAIKGKSYSVFKYLCNRGANLFIINKFKMPIKQLIEECPCKLITNFYDKYEKNKRFLTYKDCRSTFNKPNFEFMAKVIQKNMEFDCLNNNPNSRK